MRRGLAPMLAAASSFVAACGTPVSTHRCVDPGKLETCVDGACTTAACRVDAWCERDACVRWTAADSLAADFDVAPDGRDPLGIAVHVRPGGFPREFAADLRFSFGDDRGGHGEELKHRYAKAGVYAVELDVLLDDGRVLRASRPVVVGTPPAARHALFLTVDAIPAYLNGSAPYRSNAFTPDDPRDDFDERLELALPDHGFTIDVTLLDLPGAEVNRETLSLTADHPVGAHLEAGTNLADRLHFEAGPNLRVARAAWTVGPDEAFSDADVTLLLKATRADGTVETQPLTVRTVPFTADLDPFEQKLVWLLRFDMDLFSVQATPGAQGTVALAATPGANGKADFVEEVRALGAQGGESAPGATTVQRGGQVGANAVYLAWVKSEVVGQIRRVYLMTPDGRAREGIDLDLRADGEPGAPDPLLFRENDDFSVLRFGGVLDHAFGRSHIWSHQARRSDDSTVDLGIASTSLLGAISGTASAADVFAPLLATPVGDDPRDATVLSEGFDRWDPATGPELAERYDALLAAAKAIGLVLAPVAAHEMGHAMGLMPQDRPPWGFFANRQDVSFINPVGTDDAHVNFPGLNVMQAGGALLGLVGELNESTDLPDGLDLAGLLRIVSYEMRLAPYERAYLQRKLTYLR